MRRRGLRRIRTVAIPDRIESSLPAPGATYDIDGGQQLVDPYLEEDGLIVT